MFVGKKKPHNFGQVGIRTQKKVKFSIEFAGTKMTLAHSQSCRKRGVGYPGAPGFQEPGQVQSQRETEEANCLEN